MTDRSTAPLAMLFALLLAACAGSPAPRYYTLGDPAAALPGNNPRSGEPVSVWIAPVTLPEGVDRPQMVVRVAPNRVAILDQHRWAEPLGSAIARQIAAGVAQASGARVSAEAQHASAGARIRVLVDIQRFESLPRQSVAIEAMWTIRQTSNQALREGRALVTEPVEGADDFEALAAAHTRAIARLAREIQQSLGGL